MSLMLGTRVGAYEVVSAIGAGGMGEVYRARDAKLNRDVAIKVLPDSVAADPERLTRFTREAQTLAALNHPNIAHIYGFDAQANALVMELVEGEDLSSIIARGALAAPDAVPIARQIADAVEAAHEQGIIHRDLKPANVKVRADGTVKVLDFGLAKALTPDSAGASANAMNSPTLTAAATQMGMILGTAAYMAPEQAKGKTVDRRADIWAFGVILYEMLTGRRAFAGEDVSTTLAAVLMTDPDWTALPASTPAALRQLIHRCLERNPKLRLRDIGEARILLHDAEALRDQPILAAPRPSSQRPIVPWLIAGLGIGVAALTLALNAVRGAPAAPPVSFFVSYPANVRPLSNGSDNHGGALAPNGATVAFSGADMKTGKVAIYVRNLDDSVPVMIAGTDGGRYPFWAPNSRTIAYYAQGKLMRVDVDGAARQVICDAATGGWGGSWNSDDVIIAGLSDPGPIQKVSARGGGLPTPVTTVRPGDNDHDWPQFLPDGRHFLYIAWRSDFTITGTASIASIDSSDQVNVLKDLEDPASYAAPGFVLFIRSGSLMAQRFDVKTFALQGDAAVLASRAVSPITASGNGAIAFTTSMGKNRGQLSRLVSINADGADERTLVEPGFNRDPALSPDGTQLAYAKRESASGTSDVYIRDLATGHERRLTFDPADDRSPIWSPNGDEVVFHSSRQPAGVYRRKASGAGEETLITAKDATPRAPYQWHTGGFITAYGGGLTSSDILKLSLPDLKVTPLIASPGVNEMRGAVSPDGKWLAYDARESARFEVYLTTFPPSAGKWMVTTEGGAEPRWSQNGKQLLYVSSATGALMASSFAVGEPPTLGAPRQIHAGPLDWGWNSSHSFDLDSRTGRIVMSVLNTSDELTVLLNWQAVIKKP